jgi:hypothetical protein
VGFLLMEIGSLFLFLVVEDNFELNCIRILS